MTSLHCSFNKPGRSLVSLLVSRSGRCYLAIDHANRFLEYRDAIQNAYEIVISNHERRFLARCCREWRANIPKQQAATKIQAVWRGSEGRLRAAGFRDREAHFEEFAEVLRVV